MAGVPDGPIAFIPSEDFAADLSFEDAAVDAVLAGGDKPTAPKELPPHLRRLCEAELLTADQEALLFRQMNYLKFKAEQVRGSLHGDAASVRAVDEIRRCLARAQDIRDALVRANMRLAISIAKRLVTPPFSFDDILSEGTFTLVQTVEKFDYSRGFRFSTYAYRSISHNVYRLVNTRRKEDSKFLSDTECFGYGEPEGTCASSMSDEVWHSLRARTKQMLEQLDRREKFIIRSRYALGSHRKVRTFQSLADILGVSKERVRQLESRAVKKLKKMAAEVEGFDLLAALPS